MAVTQGKAKKKASGGRIISHRKKRVYEQGNLPILTKLGAKILKSVRTKGGGKKVKQAANEYANVTDSTTKKTYKVKIKGVLENSANRHFVRRNIITKGTVLDTEKGKAKVTSRPGQEGGINAVLVK